MDEKIIIVIRHTINRKRLLLRAIDSIRNQTFKNYHVLLLCENKINDDLYELCKDISLSFCYDKDEFVHFLEHFSCKYIAFLDDDDTWSPEFLNRMTSVLSNIKYSSVNAVACHVNKVNEICEANRIMTIDTQPWNYSLGEGPLSLDILYYRNCVHLSSCVFLLDSIVKLLSRHDISNPGFFWPFLIDYMSSCDIWLIPESLSFYHFREGNDVNYGNYSVINAYEFHFEYRLKLYEMFRKNSNTTALNSILLNLSNQAIFDKIIK